MAEKNKIEQLKKEIITNAWNIDMYDRDLNFKCLYLEDVLNIIDQVLGEDKSGQLPRT